MLAKEHPAAVLYCFGGIAIPLRRGENLVGGRTHGERRKRAAQREYLCDVKKRLQSLASL